MTLAVLIENGPWRLLEELTAVSVSDRKSLERTISSMNRHLRKSLGLRQDPIELRVTDSEVEVRARGIAGTFSIGQMTLNIAPKFVPKADVEQGWSHSLLMLIRYASPRDVNFGRSIYLGVARLNFVDLLAMAFIDAVQAGMRDRIIQTYQVQEMALPTIRGRLNIQRQIRSTVQRPHLIECDVDQLDTANAYNNLLKWAALEFTKTIDSSELLRRMTDLTRTMPGLPNATLAKRNAVVIPPPQYLAWQPALEIASLLCRALTHTGWGGTHGYSFVFNLERLFEHFVEITLHRAVTYIAGVSLTNHRQASTLYAVPEQPGQ
ncbi:5-methylcytosine restriction system specificity protein McrC, partial [Pseudomonas viridiflava]